MKVLEDVRRMAGNIVHGRLQNIQNDIDVPPEYRRQELKVEPVCETIGSGGAVTADVLYGLTLACVDGTNMVAAYELEVRQNGYAGASGTNAGTTVKVYREDTADASAPIGEVADATVLDSKQILSSPKLVWSRKPVKLAFSAAATYQISGYVVYFKP